MKKFCLIIFILSLCSIIVSCDSEELPAGIEELPFDGGFIMGVWHNNTILGTWPLQKLELGENLKVTRDTSLPYIPRALFIEGNDNGSRMLIVGSKYPDVCMGTLYEFEVSNWALRSIIDSSYNTSSGLYVNDSTAIIYCYGNNKIAPGYYKLNLRTSEIEILLEYLPEIGPGAVINGFDYDAENSILYYTLYRQYKTPKLIKYNLKSTVQDTLDISFDENDVECLWIRLNAANDRILYCQYSRFALTTVADSRSEIGIIDLATPSKRVLSVKPNLNWINYVSVAAHWSPDERYILYGAGELTEAGEGGLFHAFIKEVSY